MHFRVLQNSQKDMYVIRHHTILIKLYYGVILGESFEGLLDYISEGGGLDTCASRLSGSDAGIPGYRAERLAAPCFAQDDMIDERRAVVMAMAAARVGMFEIGLKRFFRHGEWFFRACTHTAWQKEAGGSRSEGRYGSRSCCLVV